MESITTEDWDVLCRINPLAQAQMESIVTLRKLKERDETIRVLQARLAQMNGHELEESPVTVTLEE